MNKHQQVAAVNLPQLAHQAMIEYGFVPDFSKKCLQQLNQIQSKADGDSPQPNLRDLRDLLWSSIDNLDSKDLDQLEYCQQLANGDIKLMVAIADVDSLVEKNTALDNRAGENCFTIYTGVRTFPMLPVELSEGLTSLVQDQDRQVMVTELVVAADGEMKSFDVYPALVRNKAKLAYEPVSDWLDGKSGLPAADSDPKLKAQLQLQDRLSDRLENLHRRRGEVALQTIEAQPVMSDGQVLDLNIQEQNRAREIIKNFMVGANLALSEYVRQKQCPMIQRVVRRPKRWGRIVELAAQKGFTLPGEPDSKALADFVAQQKAKDPLHFPDLSLAIVKLLGPGEYVVQQPGKKSEGHFGLALHDYTHSTAPNRRFPDLVTQRIVKALLSGAHQPYSVSELQGICDQCIDRETSARKLERFVRKAAAAVLLSRHIGEVYEGIVTGASEKGTYVRLFHPPAEGRVMRHEKGLDVGDRCKVKLISTDPRHGFIDFEGVS